MSNIVVFTAHADHAFTGAGGTLAKYAKEGKKVHLVVFSYGEIFRPHYKEEVVQKTIRKETEQATDILGIKTVEFLGVKDRKFKIMTKEQTGKIKKILKKHNPEKIFTHSKYDTHPDHRKVLKVTKELVEELNLKTDIYSFDIWTIARLKTRETPRLIVDVTGEFAAKIKAIKSFKSQIHAKILLAFSIYPKAILNGVKNETGFAEVFDKVN